METLTNSVLMALDTFVLKKLPEFPLTKCRDPARTKEECCGETDFSQSGEEMSFSKERSPSVQAVESQPGEPAKIFLDSLHQHDDRPRH